MGSRTRTDDLFVISDSEVTDRIAVIYLYSAEQTGLEPVTSTVTEWRSNQLNYCSSCRTIYRTEARLPSWVGCALPILRHVHVLFFKCGTDDPSRLLQHAFAARSSPETLQETPRIRIGTCARPHAADLAIRPASGSLQQSFDLLQVCVPGSAMSRQTAADCAQPVPILCLSAVHKGIEPLSRDRQSRI